MLGQNKLYVVELRSSYTVEPTSPDEAQRAILPIVGVTDDVTYTVKEWGQSLEKAAATPPADPYAHLVKAVYAADEVSEILGISRNALYESIC